MLMKVDVFTFEFSVGVDFVVCGISDDFVFCKFSVGVDFVEPGLTVIVESVLSLVTFEVESLF